LLPAVEICGYTAAFLHLLFDFHWQIDPIHLFIRWKLPKILLKEIPISIKTGKWLLVQQFVAVIILNRVMFFSFFLLFFVDDLILLTLAIMKRIVLNE